MAPRIATLALAAACLATVLGSTEYVLPMEEAFKSVREQKRTQSRKGKTEDIERIKFVASEPRDADQGMAAFSGQSWEPGRQSKIGGGYVAWEPEGLADKSTQAQRVLAKVDRDFILASAGSIASYRAAVSEHNSSYFIDPYARIFARHVCQERLEEVLKKPPAQLSRFAIRTRFFDGFVKDALHTRGIQQVVIIGAGFDARALRPVDLQFFAIPPREPDPNPFAKPKEDPGLRFFELDLPEMIQAKKAILSQVEHTKDAETLEFEKATNLPSVSRIGVDIMLDDWRTQLISHGFDPAEPTCFLLEGFLYYFDEASVRRTMRIITSLAAPGSRIGLSGVSRAATASANSTSRFVWGTDEPEAFVERFGWEGAAAYQFGDPQIAFGWDLPKESVEAAEIPRSDTSQKRTWYIIATRSPPPKTLLQQIAVPILRFRDKISPFMHRVAPWVVDVFENGLRIPIPLPRFLDPDLD